MSIQKLCEVNIYIHISINILFHIKENLFKYTIFVFNAMDTALLRIDLLSWVKVLNRKNSDLSNPVPITNCTFFREKMK